MDVLYWKYSLYELIQRVQLRLGFETSVLLSQHSAMVDIASAMFADPKKAKKAKNVTDGAPTYEAAIANMNSILKWG